MHRYAGSILILALIGTSHGAPTGVSLPARGRHILEPNQATQSLTQCSRNTPNGVTSYWKPSAAQIDHLEKSLLVFLSQSRSPPEGAYGREYIGIGVNGILLIYGNYYPLGGPTTICDGGPQYWGIVFDPAKDRFTDLEFNGVA